MRDRWYFWRAEQAEPASNMAWDAHCHESAAARKVPLFRSYGWTLPAATFGYFQHYREIESLTRLRPILRRPTGGGLVPHDADWTYSLTVPPLHPWFKLRATDSYERVHRWIAGAFKKLGVEAELAPCCRKEIPGACFSGFERFDVLYRGQKIAGAAQRRNQDGLLIQGSVHPPPRIARAAWEKSMLEFATEIFEVEWKDYLPSGQDIERVAELTRERFGSDSFNQRR